MLAWFFVFRLAGRDPHDRAPHAPESIAAFQIMPLFKQSGRHRAPTRMAAAAIDARVSVQLSHMGLQGITGGVIDLLTSAVDPALTLHAVLKAFESED